MKVLVTGGSGFIGTSLIDALAVRGVPLLNLDAKRPLKPEHQPSWRACDILDSVRLRNAVAEFGPTHIVHLAARTDVAGRTIEEYAVNTQGTANLLAAIAHSPSVTRVLITSSQFVHQYQGLPAHDEDFAPHTLYGESKVVAEQLTRSANLQCEWAIIRPTNIWGPWHPRYPLEFWKVLSRGLYVHPGRARVVRSYGYVGNVVHQIISLLTAPAARVDGRVFYVGDQPIDLYDWVNGFSLQQIGKPVKVFPTWCVKGMAVLGDILGLARIPFPLTLSRYKSMTTSNAAPMDAIHELCGDPPYTLEAGIAETVKWLRVHHPTLVRVR
jgi:nucleoside-diphosphate-sugar epimerase